jgi:trehalose synthase-fused probable maltokinase
MDQSLPPFDALHGDALPSFIRDQRWFGAKSNEIAGVEVVDGGELRREPALLVDTLVEVRYGSGTHDLYQLVLGSTEGEPGGPVIAESGGRRTYEAACDPAFARELIDLIGRGAMLDAAEGTIEFCSMAGSSRDGASIRDVRSLGVEQSNTSVVIDDELMVKVYRRIEAGVNPELEMLHFLGVHGFENTPKLWGWWSYAGSLMSASLGMIQEFVPDAVDGWSLAQQELPTAPEAFIDRARRLGEVIGRMHAVLASEPDDPAFSPDSAGQESLALLTATVDEEIDNVFVTLPDNDVTAPILGRGEAMRALLRELSTVGSVGKRIRHHGDLHLGQMLWAKGDWLVIDFEGEPARPIPERRLKHSPLRDVAGMLRSFTYAVAVAGVQDASVEQRARAGFLDGYLEAVQAADILPPRETTERLLRIYELEKAVYELRYELANRPDWVWVPVGGIVRLLEQTDT